MKSIQLNTARATNGGQFRDAGSIVDVGDKPDQINAKAAKALTDAGLAAAPKPEPTEGKDKAAQ
jgi:hypothetical protein